LVELPDLGLWDLVAGVRDDGMGHIHIGLVIADSFVGELVLEDGVVGREDVEGTFPFVVDGQCQEHDPGAGVEISDGELHGMWGTSRSRR